MIYTQVDKYPLGKLPLYTFANDAMCCNLSPDSNFSSTFYRKISYLQTTERIKISIFNVLRIILEILKSFPNRRFAVHFTKRFPLPFCMRITFEAFLIQKLLITSVFPALRNIRPR